MCFSFLCILDTDQILTIERVICSPTIWLAQHHISVSLFYLIGLSFSCCCVSWSTCSSYITEKYVCDLSDHNICNWKNDSGYANLWLPFALVAVCHDPPVFPVQIIHICDLSNHNICNWKKWQQLCDYYWCCYSWSNQKNYCLSKNFVCIDNLCSFFLSFYKTVV